MSLTRKQFLQRLLFAGAGCALPVALRAQTAGKPHYDFYFTRLMYESGDWDVDQRMPSNVLNSLIEYTNLKVDPKEHIVPLADPEMLLAPFCYMAGHKLVEFTEAEARNFRDYVNRGGFIFVDDCNHDIDGLFAKSFEAQMVKLFGEDCLQKLPDDHDLYRCFFQFDELPVTSFELNGWGDDLVHDYLKAIVVNGRIAVLYSNKDFGCEWDYDYRNKRWLAIDNTKFAINIVIYALTT
ncbi:DUF4159 domain-containing protein [Microbulbifer sp. YPW1]|uniref:DUF4159 domain-containing protein n=1 Tax=Microbulbifer sp. YPW1 TaxID=2745199 RepID=UPI001597BFD4|nr:DUF4159 domain-containing protein [Microbulbifer sp. YPW1]QKX16597.1 DUF4159 domain-containing protein [Microbulbifer sp. YPW1]